MFDGNNDFYSKNPTGEGIYLFRTVFNQEIHDQIEEAAERIKKKVAGRQRSVPTIPASKSIHKTCIFL